MVTTIYTHEAGLLHDTGSSHKERADRLRVIYDLLNEKPFSELPRVKTKPASEDRLTLAHPYSYVQHIEGSIPNNGHVALDSDTVVSPGSWEAALHTVGAVCDAVDDVIAGKTKRAFCPMRPPGHHAEPAVSMGFCLFNNVFIGARHAQEKHGIEKVAIIDFDVHHGNGTDSMARRHDGSILFISTHQYPLWPMTGLEDDNDECVLNFVLPPDSGSDLFRKTYMEKVFPALNDFAPDLLIISAGFDAHKDDQISQINLTEDDFKWVTEELCKIADRHADGRVVSVLEGGYNLESLKTSVAAHLLGLST